MSLKSILNSQSLNKSDLLADVPKISGAKIIRTMKLKSFDFEEAGSYTEFEEFLDDVDASDIVHIQFSNDLRKVKVVYTAEVKRIPRKEFDNQLPVESEPIQDSAGDLFSTTQ
jgi:hypothetical protein